MAITLARSVSAGFGVLLVLFAGLLLGCGRSSPRQVSPERLAFLSDRAEDGVPVLYYVDGAGSVQRFDIGTLYPGERTVISNAAPSPDGKALAFDAQPALASGQGNQDIFVRDIATGDVRRLTDDPGFDAAPSWSPDGRRIAFLSSRAGGGLYVMEADGSGEAAVDEPPGTAFVWLNSNPWSPDGKRLAFTVVKGEGENIEGQIWLADATTLEATPLTTGPDSHAFAGWRPGSELLTVVRQDGQQIWIELLALDGSTNQLLFHGSCDTGVGPGMAWTPDGARLAAALTPGDCPGPRAIYLLEPGAPGSVRVTGGDDDGWFGLAWDSAGRLLAFSRGADFESVEIWTVDPESGRERMVADAPAYFPLWMAAGSTP